MENILDLIQKRDDAFDESTKDIIDKLSPVLFKIIDMLKTDDENVFWTSVESMEGFVVMNCLVSSKPSKDCKFKDYENKDLAQIMVYLVAEAGTSDDEDKFAVSVAIPNDIINDLDAIDNYLKTCDAKAKQSSFKDDDSDVVTSSEQSNKKRYLH